MEQKLNKKASFLLGAGPSHLFYHASAVALSIIVIMVALWIVLLCVQTMPTHDFSQLPSFFFNFFNESNFNDSHYGIFKLVLFGNVWIMAKM